MKRFFLALTIFLITLLSCVLSSLYVVNFCNKTEDIINEISEKLEFSDTDLEKINTHFTENRVLLTAFINHNAVQDLEIAVFRFTQYYKLGMEEDMKKEAIEIKMIIEDMKYNGIVSSESIF